MELADTIASGTCRALFIVRVRIDFYIPGLHIPPRYFPGAVSLKPKARRADLTPIRAGLSSV